MKLEQKHVFLCYKRSSKQQYYKFSCRILIKLINAFKKLCEKQIICMHCHCSRCNSSTVGPAPNQPDRHTWPLYMHQMKKHWQFKIQQKKLVLEVLVEVLEVTTEDFSEEIGITFQSSIILPRTYRSIHGQQ